MSDEAPFIAREADIEAGWIDYNGHLNMAYYNVLFDRGADQAFESFGMTDTYAHDEGMSFYVAEVHVCYVRELHLGSRVRASFQLLEIDEKKLHAYQELRHHDGWLAATSETLYLHIGASGPKVVPIAAPMFEKIRNMHTAHRSLPWPERAGRQIKIKR